MTGTEIESIRGGLGLTLPQFAQLLGVHVTTVYRWAGAKGEQVRLDPLHTSLLLKTQESLAQRKAKAREVWAGEILKALLIGGTLAGLALILIEALPKGGLKGK